MSRCQPFWTQQDRKWDRSRISANPDKGRAGKRKIKYTDRPRDTSTSDNKCTSACTRMNLKKVLKIIIWINHLSKNYKNLYTYSNYLNALT